MKLITPKSHEHWLELRSHDVTSTEVSALFGLNPYMTAFELWHRKKHSEIVQIEETERMKWGSRLESAIGHGIAEDQGWHIIEFKDYGCDPDLRAGSSFDFKIGIPKDVAVDQVETTEGLLEIKNVDPLAFKNKWIVDQGRVVEAPPHIEIQVQHQLMITGLSVAYIGALVGGNSVTLLKRTPQPQIIEKIRAKIKAFWKSIEADQPPKPDFERDADFIVSLYQSAEPGKVIDGQDDEALGDLVGAYNLWAQKEKEAINHKKILKAQILERIGDAEKVTSDQFTISASVVGPQQVSFERKGYRTFRVFNKQTKGDSNE